MHHSNGTRTQTTMREPLPVYNENGEDATPSSLPDDLLPTGPEPTPVTARKAPRGRLWDGGILVLMGRAKATSWVQSTRI